MNLVDQILAEYSKKQRDKIVKYIGNDEKRFAQLIDIFLKGPYRVTQRAAWPISYCVEKSPHLLAPHLKKILILLGNNTIDDPVKRNILRMLQFIIIPKAHQGITSNLCFGFLSQHKEPIAVRVFSMTVLAKPGPRST